MPLRVQPIYSDNPGAIANASFTLPPSLDLELSSIRARVNGAAAASSFIVVAELLTSDGRILAQSPIDQTLAIGDTLAGTWAPFLRSAAAAAPPPSGGVPIQWVYYESTTNWGAAGLTTLVFTEQGGNYDASPATFGLSGAGNPQIKVDGHYETQVGIFNYNVTPGVATVLRADLTRVSGPTPASWRSIAGPVVIGHAGEWSTVPVVLWPYTVDFWDYAPGTFIGTPSTLQVKAWRLDAGVITADTDVIVRVAIRRLGDSFS